MSSMEIYEVRPSGEVVARADLKNSFRGPIMVWMSLCKKYLGSTGGFSDWERTWALQHSARITDAEFCVLMSTFDNCIISRGQFDHAARCFEEFDREFPGHYGACTGILRELLTEDAIGFCVNGTSVNENPWWVHTEGGDDGVPYNVNTGTKHWFFDPAMRPGMIAEVFDR